MIKATLSTESIEINCEAETAIKAIRLVFETAKMMHLEPKNWILVTKPIKDFSKDS